MDMVEIPAYVRHESFQQNRVQVVGGTNWDLSRTAIETPVTLVPEPEPVQIAEPPPDLGVYKVEDSMPTGKPTLIVKFAKNSVLLTKEAAAQLSSVERDTDVVVAGHADFEEKKPSEIALKRAKAIAAKLKRRGIKVQEVRGFSDDAPATVVPEEAAQNQRVEVYVR